MKFAVGKRNDAIRHSFLPVVVQYECSYHSQSNLMNVYKHLAHLMHQEPENTEEYSLCPKKNWTIKWWRLLCQTLTDLQNSFTVEKWMG